MVNAELLKSVTEVGKQKAAEYGQRKANETLDDQTKFQATLDKVAEDKRFLTLKTKWNALSEKDKEKVYNAGKQMGNSKAEKIIDPLGLGIVQSTKSLLPSKFYESSRLNGMKLLAPGQTFEPVLRLSVHLGLLSKPKGIQEETMLADMQLDFKSMNTKLAAFEAVASVIPVLMPLVPVIQMLRWYIQKLGAAGTQALINRQTGTQNTPKENGDTAEDSTEPPHQAAKDTTVLEADIKTKEVKKEVTAKPVTPVTEQKEWTQQVKSENKGAAPVGKEDSVEHVAN